MDGFSFTAPHVFLFAFGLAALIGVWWARMTPTYSNLTLVVGILAISCAVCFHPFVISQPPFVRTLWTIATLAVLALAGYYTLWVPNAKEPVFHATVVNANYPPGIVIGEIPWSSRFADLRLTIINDGAARINDIDLAIKLDVPIAKAGQITRLLNVTFSPIDAPVTFQMQHQDGKTGIRTAIPLNLIGIDTGYQLHCKELPPRSKLEIVIAAAVFNQCDGDENSPFKNRPRGGVFDREYCFHLTSNTGDNAWYGHGNDTKGLIEDVYAVERPLPKRIQINGSYSSVKGQKKVNQHIDLADAFGEVILGIQQQLQGKD